MSIDRNPLLSCWTRVRLSLLASMAALATATTAAHGQVTSVVEIRDGHGIAVAARGDDA